jgi:hypothetical protein
MILPKSGFALNHGLGEWYTVSTREGMVTHKDVSIANRPTKNLNVKRRRDSSRWSP